MNLTSKISPKRWVRLSFQVLNGHIKMVHSICLMKILQEVMRINHQELKTDQMWESFGKIISKKLFFLEVRCLLLVKKYFIYICLSLILYLYIVLVNSGMLLIHETRKMHHIIIIYVWGVHANLYVNLCVIINCKTYVHYVVG